MLDWYKHVSKWSTLHIKASSTQLKVKSTLTVSNELSGESSQFFLKLWGRFHGIFKSFR